MKTALLVVIVLAGVVLFALWLMRYIAAEGDQLLDKIESHKGRRTLDKKIAQFPQESVAQHWERYYRVLQGKAEQSGHTTQADIARDMADNYRKLVEEERGTP